MRPLFAVALGFALAGLVSPGAIVSPARADDPAPPPAAAPKVPEETLKLAHEIGEELDVGRHASAVARLDTDACATLAAVSPAAFDVAAAVMRTYPVALKLDPASAKTLVDRLDGLATADDPSAHAKGVRAIRDLLRSLTGRLHGRPGPYADPRTVVAALRKLEASLPPLDRVYAGAFKVARLVEAARATDADAWRAMLATADPLRKREEELRREWVALSASPSLLLYRLGNAPNLRSRARSKRCS